MPIQYLQNEDTLDSGLGSDEAFLRQVVAPGAVAAPGDWMSALQQQNPNWILQAIQSMPASMESGEAGPIEGFTFYDPSKTSTSDTFKRYDVSGNLLGEQKFKTPGDIADLAIEAGVDLAPILQYTPFGPAVNALAAINAAKEGDILPAIVSAAGFGGYENVAKAAQAASALKNEDYLGAVLPALQASGIKDIGGYGQEEIGKMLNVARAIDQGPLALISAASKYLPTETAGFMLPETADPTEFWYPSELSEATPISAPERMAFLEANIAEPETVQQLMQQYYPEIYETAPAPEAQRIEVTGQRESPIEQTAFEQYMQQYAAPTEPPGMIEGPQTIEVTGKREPVLFPEFDQPLLTAEPMPTVAAPTAAPTAAAPATAPTPAAPAKKQDDLGLLMLLASMMTPQQQAKDDYQLAQIGVQSPYGIYGA